MEEELKEMSLENEVSKVAMHASRKEWEKKLIWKWMKTWVRKVLRESGLVVELVEEVVREVGLMGMEDEDMDIMLGMVDWECKW